MKYYIAYGSNLSVEQMKRRCPDAFPVGKSILRDWQLVFRYHATIAPKAGFDVPVVVWDISETDEKALDRYEGFPYYYRKEYLTVPLIWFKTHRRQVVQAMVYIMNESGTRIIPPSNEYYDVIASGYNRFNFDEAILQKALDESIFQSVVEEEAYYKEEC